MFMRLSYAPASSTPQNTRTDNVSGIWTLPLDVLGSLTQYADNVRVPDTEASDTAVAEPPVLKSPARGNPGSENERDDPEIATVDDRALGSPSKRAAKRRKKGKSPRVKRDEPQTVKLQRSSGTHAVNVPSVEAPRPPSSDKRPILAALSNATQTTHARLHTEPEFKAQADFLQIPIGAVSTSRGNPAVDSQVSQPEHIYIRQGQPNQMVGPPDDPPVTVSSEPRIDTASLSTSTGSSPLCSPTTLPFVRHTDVKEPHHPQAQHSRKRSLSGSLVARGPGLPSSRDKTPDEVRAPESALDSSPRAESAAGSSSGTGATLHGATSVAHSSYAMVYPRFDAMHMPWVPDRPPMPHPTYPSSDGWYFYVCEGCAMRLF